jgi:hypothetical protein
MSFAPVQLMRSPDDNASRTNDVQVVRQIRPAQGFPTVPTPHQVHIADDFGPNESAISDGGFVCGRWRHRLIWDRLAVCKMSDGW